MNDPINIVGFYFTLIGFLSGIFFTRLDSWYSDVRSKKALITSINKREKLLSFEETLISLKASRPLSGFLAIGCFVVALAVLSLFLPRPSSNLDLLLFLYVPLFVTVLGYLIGGGLLLVSGTRLIKKSSQRVDNARIGNPLS